jgi:shikimate dehydrogenase
MKIVGGTQLIGIFGYPLTYTLSPFFQNAGLEALKLNAVYLPFPVKKESFIRAFQGFQAFENSIGANITNPYKQAVIPLLDRLAPEAKKIGAVNTVVKRNGLWWGHNTDAIGFLRSIHSHAPQGFKKKQVWVLGAGGAARALAYAALQDGASKVHVMARRLEQAQALCAELDASKKRSLFSVLPNKIDQAIAPPDWIINTIPAPIVAAKMGRLTSDLPACKVYDIIYDPPQTEFLKKAISFGHQGSNGLGMLLEQGLEAFSIWTGSKAPRLIMNRALHMVAPVFKNAGD